MKQNGEWKFLNFTLINNNAYGMMNTINRMKTFACKWVLDGQASMEPSDGKTKLNMLKFNLKVTPNGLEQFSNYTVTNNGHSFSSPGELEYFIPDYRTNTISYMDIQKNPSGQTFTSTGKVTSGQPNSFTVTEMYPDKPTQIENEYTVSMQDGHWHQIGKRFDKDGKQISTSSVNLRRVE